MSEVATAFSAFLWGAPMLIILIGVGVFLTFNTGFVQVRRFGYALRLLFRSANKKNKNARSHSLTSFQSFTTALGATVGIGNIVGVAGAIALGGPGAVFWMWVAGIIGMATKYCEIVLAVRYRERRANGNRIGGPMYYIKKGLGKRFSPLAVMFAVFGCIAVLGTGNMAQINTVAEVTSSAVITLAPSISGYDTVIKLVVGILFALVIGRALLGGAKRVGYIAERVVPPMALLYLLCVGAVIALNIEDLLPTLSLILHSAFDPMSALGAGVGVSMSHALRLGFARGIFSNEAGLGTSPIAYASNDCRSAVEQGLLGVIEVFVDTIVICTATALCILMSGVALPYGEMAGIGLAMSGFEGVFGERITALFVAIMVSLFAFTSMLTFSMYGVRCFEFLFGGRGIGAYRIVYVLFVVVGSLTHLELVWEISSVFNGLMAIPNLIAVTLLAGEVRRLTRGYFMRVNDL